MATVLTFASSNLYAQDRTVTGRVTSTEDGSALPGVNVILKGTTNGTATDADGKYSLTVPSSGGYLLFSFIGLQSKEIEIGERSVVDVSLALDVTQLSEIVITGVSEGTSIRKLSFALTKVNEKLLQETPAVDAGNALRGKVSGVQIIQSSGTQGNAASIRLRGATTLSNNVNSEPLIIIDGVITPPGSSSLADINMNDVQSIEVVKGAAGAALYGSLAGNGVIQIITKRGSREDKTVFTVRNEYGVSSLQRKMDVNMRHNYELDANGDLVYDVDGNLIDDVDPIMDNKWPVARDQQEALFKGQSFYSNYFSMSSNEGKTSYFTSVDNLSQGGIIDGIRSFDRQNIRLNVDHNVNDKFKISSSTLYTYSKGPGVVGEGGQGGIVYEVMRLSPGANPFEKNFDGQPYNTTNFLGAFNPGRNSNNPLYTANNDKFTITRERLLGNFGANYKVNDWWKLDGQISFDRASRNSNRFLDKKYLNINSSISNPYSNSLISKNKLFSTSKVYSLTSNFNKTFNDLSLGLSLRYQAEEYKTDYLSVNSADNIVVDGIDQTNNIPTDAIRTSSYNEVFRAENYFANLKVDYKSRYILDALIRRDASSLFGSNVRSQIFYRASGAYRVSEDFKIPGIQELKLRASIGTSGQRPPFDAQYETVPLDNGTYDLGNGTKGNADLKPSLITEFETGINVSFLNRFDFEFNYAKTVADDQILLIPLSATTGYREQWQNAGAIESKTFEFSLNAHIFDKDELKWDIGVVGSRTTNKVTELNRPEFSYRGGSVGSGSIFRVKEGESLGAIYGGVLATRLSQLTVDVNGFVNNLEGASGLTPDQFTVNRDGFIIVDGTEFTATERPFNLKDPVTNTRIDKKIGDGTPDFILGINSTVSYKGFSLYMLFDSQLGGDIANVNKQNMMFNEIAVELDQSKYPEGERKNPSYFVVLSNSGSAPNQYFIEDGSFTTLREVSLSYTFGKSFMEKLGKFGDLLTDAKLSVSGRNLYTFTKYSGWTPEVAATGGGDNVASVPFNFRADYGAVPLFRTYSVALQVRF